MLSGFDFARWRPRLILLEDHVGASHAPLSHARRLSADPALREQRLVCPEDAPAEVGWLERWEIVRKYYLALPFRIARNASRSVRRRLREVDAP